MWIHARKCLFLSAGSFGTTEILLRSKEMGLGVSDKIGTGIIGNGDLLAFKYDYSLKLWSAANSSVIIQTVRSIPLETQALRPKILLVLVSMV
jgi:hypothetical protein